MAHAGCVTKIQHILSICMDPDLSASRTMLLRDAGLEVAAAGSRLEAEQAIAEGEFDALIVGHTVETAVATAVTETFRRVNPQARVIFVASGWFIPIRADRVVQASDGPHALLRALLSSRG